MSVKSLPDDWVESIESSRDAIADSLGVSKGVLGGVTAIVLAILVGGPMVFYIWASFWSTSPGLGGHFTLVGYEKLFRPVVYDTVYNTVVFTILGTLTALVFGIGGAFISLKTDLPGRRAIPYMYIANYVLPSFVVAIAYEAVANPTIGLVNNVLITTPFFSSPPLDTHTIWAISLIAGVHYAGLVYLLVSGAIRSIPASLEESASLSGASSFEIIRRIDLPLIKPSITIAVVLLVSRFTQAFGIPLTLGFPNQIYVMATFMYRALTTFPPDFNFGAAIGMVILTVTVIGLIIHRSIKGQSEKYEVIGGRGSAETMKFETGRFRYHLSGLLIGIVFVLLAFPILVLFMVSFQKGLALPGKTIWTLENYRWALFGPMSNRVVPSLVNSFIVSFGGASIGMVLASISSYYIIKSDSIIGGFLDFLTLSPAAVPGIVVATAFLWFTVTYQFLGLYGTLWVIILAFTAKFIVYGTRSTNSSFQAIDTELEEAAELSGASFTQILRKVYLPLIRPGFFAGFMLLFIDYMKILSIPLLLGGRGNALYVTVIWDFWLNARIEPAIAMSSILVAIILGIYALVGWFTNIELTEL